MILLKLRKGENMKDMIKELFDTQSHFGHNRKYRTPQLRSYLYTTVNKIDIIDLEKSVCQILFGKNFISKHPNFNILIVSSKLEDLSSDNIQVIKKWKTWLHI